MRKYYLKKFSQFKMFAHSQFIVLQYVAMTAESEGSMVRFYGIVVLSNWDLERGSPDDCKNLSWL